MFDLPRPCNYVGNAIFACGFVALEASSTLMFVVCQIRAQDWSSPLPDSHPGQVRGQCCVRHLPAEQHDRVPEFGVRVTVNFNSARADRGVESMFEQEEPNL